jgi:hypothetical protein
MTWKNALLLAPAALLLGCGQENTSPLEPVTAEAGKPPEFSAAGGRNHGALGEVYVTSQGKYYDTFVTAETLPRHGRFQKLEGGTTMYGPGDAGYLGGRWWVDVNGDNQQDAGDKFLLCPLLPPGR